MKQQDIREASLPGLSELLSSWGQPSFRAKQIYAWLWQHNAQSFEEMTNLPIVLREKLNEYFIFLNIALDKQQRQAEIAREQSPIASDQRTQIIIGKNKHSPRKVFFSS